MNLDKKKFLINTSIISIYNIILSIFFYIQADGEAIAFFFILPTVAFVILYAITYFKEVNFAKQSYKTSHLFNYFAILATIIILLGIYTDNKSSSPGGGIILFFFGALWVIPMIVALISYFIGFFSKSKQMSEQMSNDSGLSKSRSLFFVLNIMMSALFMFLFVGDIYQYISHSYRTNIDYAIFIPIFVLLGASILTRKKSSVIYWVTQVLSIVIIIYIVLKAIGFRF